MSVEKSSFTISTLQEVSKEVSAKPIVGFEKTSDLPSGWQFDIKRWAGVFDRRLPVLPRLSNPSYQGLDVSEFFKSGVSSTSLNDFNLLSVSVNNFDSSTIWTPIIRPGLYFRYNEDFNLFSDDSIVQYLSQDDDKSGRHSILLSRQPSDDTDIVAITYKRHESSKYPRKHVEARLVGEFSGTYSGGEEQETIDNLGTINWSNVDTTKKEFILDTSYADKYYLRFNRDDYIFDIGRAISSYDEIGACENAGTATGADYQIFYTKYFPIIANSVHVYVADDSSYTEWTQVDSFFDLENNSGSNNFYVDGDIGAIYFGDGGNAPADGLYIMVTYRVTMRIEYEPFDTDNKITCFDADVNPVNQSQNQGFVCITHDIPEAASISLKIDKDSISGTSPTEYGPIYTGSDYAVLRAEVLSSTEVVVPKVEVTFTLTPYFGYLVGSDESTSITNGAGHAFSSYQPPTNSNNLGFYSRTVRNSTHASYPSGSYKEVIIHDEDASLEGKEEQVFIYQILRDDLFLGYYDIDTYIASNIDPPSWVGTPLNDTNDNFVQWKEELILEHGWREWEDPGSPDSGQDVDGRKVIIYQVSGSDNIDTEAIDPDNGSIGTTVVPVKPELVDQITDDTDEHYGKWRAIYEAGAIADVTGDLAGYWIGASRLVKFKAACWSPYYNKTIESDEVIARIAPPSYMLGEYLFEGDKVPYGWKLPDEFNSLASAVGGTTFITINPKLTPYQVVNVIGTETTDDYVSNQFNVKSFRFEFTN